MSLTSYVGNCTIAKAITGDQFIDIIQYLLLNFSIITKNNINKVLTYLSDVDVNKNSVIYQSLVHQLSHKELHVIKASNFQNSIIRTLGGKVYHRIEEAGLEGMLIHQITYANFVVGDKIF